MSSVGKRSGRKPAVGRGRASALLVGYLDIPAVFRFHPPQGSSSVGRQGCLSQARRGAGGGFVFAALPVFGSGTRDGPGQFLGSGSRKPPSALQRWLGRPEGRFWAGSTYADDQFRPEGSLYRLAPAAGPDHGGRAGVLQRPRLEPGQQDDVRHCAIRLRAVSVRLRPGNGDWPTAGRSPRCRRQMGSPMD